MVRRAYSIRTAREEDASGILECLRLAFEPYRSAYSEEAFLDTVLTPETIGQRMSEMTVFVAADESGQVVGTIACKRDREEGHLRGMAVLPQWQGCGLATELLIAAERHLSESGCTRITLDTTAPLERAVCFYERHGYRASGRIDDFFGLPLYEYQKTITHST